MKQQKLSLSIVISIADDFSIPEGLLERIHVSAFQGHITYELVFVDSGLSYKAQHQVRSMGDIYPIRIVKMQKGTNKSSAILKGIEQAKYPFIATLDLNFTYPPEALPFMLMALVEDKCDVVIATRETVRKRVFRRKKSASNQSSTLIFRKSIVEHIQLNDKRKEFKAILPRLARLKGFRVGSYGVDYLIQNASKTKLHLGILPPQTHKHSFEVEINSQTYIPFSETQRAAKGDGFHYRGDEFIPHNTLSRSETALQQTSGAQKAILVTFLLGVISSLVFNWHSSLIILIAALTFLYFADLLFNLNLIIHSLSKDPSIKIDLDKATIVHNEDWPTYTILCPLYKEAAVLPQFVQAMTEMDYPGDKLQIMLLLEEDDVETYDAANGMVLPECFEIVVVPHSMPKTKPKACNFGLLQTTGEYVVIYDAEDVPDPQQLKKAYLAFMQSRVDVACIQCKLNFYNPHQNILTRAFTAEYSLWFDLILTGMQQIDAPIPLGGTSNHFKTDVLKQLGAWDAFNVTEDADLGMRLVKSGYKTRVLDSTTLEEANSSLKNWFWQRSRWVKGYIQTYLVHTRDLKSFRKDGKRNIGGLTFQLIIGGKVLSMLINPIMWLLTIVYFVWRPVVGPTIESIFPMPVLYMGVVSLIFGNFLYLYYYMIGCARRQHYELIKYALFIPAYWIAMSAAAYYAVFELLYKPHHWRKTKHGLHLTSPSVKAGLLS